MPAPVSRRTAAAAIAVGLVGCAAKPPPAAFAGPAVVRKIAFVPATEPLEFTFKNENAALNMFLPTALALYSNNKVKRQRFNEVLSAPRPVMAARLNDVVVAALREDGYVVEVPETLKRNPGDPDNVPFAGIATDADVILQLRIVGAGIWSTNYSPNYVPLLNISARLWIPSRDERIYYRTFSYGVDAKEDKARTVVAGPGFTYRTFEDALERISEIRETFVVGADALAPLMAQGIREALATKTARS